MDETKPKRFFLVALDETEFFQDEALKAKTGKIWTIYMYNPDEATHCCEITPSYYLIPVDYKTENCLKCDEENPDQEAIHDLLQESVWASDPVYIHCSSIDRISQEFKYEPDYTFEDEEEAIEYYQTNCKL